MKELSQIVSRKLITGIYLSVILPLLVIGLTYFITQTGATSAILVLVALFGSVFAVLAILVPVIGYYTAVIFAFFMFDLDRLAGTGIPVGTVMDIMIYLTFVGVLLRKIAIKESFWKNCYHPIVFAYIVIIAYSIIEMFNPLRAPLDVTFNIFRRFISLMLFFYCSIQFFTDRKAILRFVKIFFAFALIAGLYGCYQEWFGYPRYEMNFILSDPIKEGLYSLDNGNYRKFSSFSGPTDFGLLMAASVLVGIVLWLNQKSNWKRTALYISGIIVLALAMSYSGTRTATFMLTIGVVLYILMTLTDKRTLIFSCLFGAGFVFLIYGPIYGNATINRLRSTFEFSEEASLQVRDVNRRRIQPFIHSTPLGGGLGTSGFGSAKYNPDHPLADFPPDSGMLRMAIEYGWVGFLIQCLTYFLVVQQGIHAYYRSKFKENKVLFLAATVLLFGYIVAQYAQVAIGFVPGAFAVYAMMAVIIRLRQIELSSEPIK